MLQVKKKYVGIAAIVVAVSAVAAIGVSVLTEPSGTAFPVPSTIASDCSAFVDGALNSFLASVPSGIVGTAGPIYRTVTFKAGACYKIKNPLLFIRRAYVDYVGQFTTIDAKSMTAGSQDTFRIRYSHHLSLKGFIVQGGYTRPSFFSGAPYEWSAGFEVAASHDVTVESNEVHNVFGDGVETAPAFDGAVPVNIYNVTIRNNLIDGAGREGVSITGGHDFLVEGNTIRNVPWVFDLELEWAAAGFGIENVTLRGNHSGLYRLVWLPNGGGCGTHKNVLVENNVMDRSGPTSWPPVSIENPFGCPQRGPYAIRGNVFRMPGGGAFYGLQSVGGGSNDLLVDGNTFIFEQSDARNYVAKLQSSHRAKFTNNKVQGGTKLVLNLGASDWTASGNICGVSSCQ